VNPFNTEDSNLDEAIASAFADLKAHSADEEGYHKTVDQLTKLYALKHKRVDPNTVLTVAGNIFIGLAVIKYEQTGVISSKVMSFMKKI
jgi:CHASE3 domain sensor protein